MRYPAKIDPSIIPLLAILLTLMTCAAAIPAHGADLCGHMAPGSPIQYNLTVNSSISTASFVLSWNCSGSYLDLALTRPDGDEINSSSADNDSVFYIEGDLQRLLIINDPEPGNWSIGIRPLEVPQEGTMFCLSSDLTPGMGGSGESSEPAYRGARFDDCYSGRGSDANDDGLYGSLVVEAGINASSPGDYSIKGWLCDAEGRRIISSEDRTHLEAGSQTARLNFSGPVIRARLPKTPLCIRDLVLKDHLGRPADQRDLAFCIPEIGSSDFIEPPGRFSGIYSDGGKDPGTDGKFAGLALGVGLDVSRTDNFAIRGTLYDRDGKRVTGAGRSTYTYPLYPGSGEMELEFDGFSISDAGANGPYELRDLGLYAGKGWSILVDYLPYACTTSSYDHTQFRERPARIGANLSDCGSDTDGDGLYDFLTVGADINVIIPGNYSLMGELHDDRGRQLAWSMDQGTFPPGQHEMHLDFDDKTLQSMGVDGPYEIKNITLYGEDLTFVDAAEAYTTSSYKGSEFADPKGSEKVISGKGTGELLVTISIWDSVPAFRGRYSYDLMGINIPPILSVTNASDTRLGHSYSLPGVFVPAKPNNFTVEARGVKSLNIGLKKISGAELHGNASRTWVTAQIRADEEGVASVDNDLLSPGRYQFKIFGEAEENATSVDLRFTAVKKLVIGGNFSLAVNAGGFPGGNCSISARALGGPLRLEGLAMDGIQVKS